jgi:hypothetical protein
MYGLTAVFLYFLSQWSVFWPFKILLILLFTTGIEFAIGYGYWKIKKIRILLDGNRYFGNLLVIKLHNNNHAIKFSFKNKVGLMESWERSFVSLKKFLFTNPQIEKNIPNGESLEITYHVEGQKLEISKYEVFWIQGEHSIHLFF